MPKLRRLPWCETTWLSGNAGRTRMCCCSVTLDVCELHCASPKSDGYMSVYDVCYCLYVDFDQFRRESFRRRRLNEWRIEAFFAHSPRVEFMTIICCCVAAVSSRRQVEWEAASSLIEGICLTLQRQPIISFLPHLRSLINVCVNLVGQRAMKSKTLYIVTGSWLFVCIVRWWVWWVLPVWPMGFLFSTWAPTSLLRCPSALQWSDWWPCRSRWESPSDPSISNAS